VNPLAYLAVFGAGIASFAGPCVLPLVPAYVAAISGDLPRGTRPLMRDSAAFVAGFTAVFVALGMLAAAVGTALDDAQAWTARIGGSVIVVFGLVLLGVVRGPLGREARLGSPWREATGALRALLVGVTFGAAWTPCVGPLLGASLLVAARSGAAWRGAELLVAYALGVGVPFIAVSLSLASSPGLLRRIRTVARPMERAAGALMVVLGAALLTGKYATLIAPLARIVPTT
jgi:cytochrome c-type biogenesis protein